MYSTPEDPADEQRLVTAHATAAAALGTTVTGPPVWGWHGRTLGRRADHPAHGTCWLRLLSAPKDKATGKIWDGTLAAANVFPGVHKPPLHAVRDHTTDGTAYRAELTGYIDAPVCSPDPVLRHHLVLPETWWKSLRTDLDTIAATPTDRIAVRQQWIDRAVPQFLGVPAPQVTEWATGHGDLHWANLTETGPVLLDWEGFGLAPAGYDQALLLAYSRLQPYIATHVSEVFADILHTDAGRVAQLVVAAELLQSASRGDHPDLVPPLRAHVGTFISTQS
ncbi:hypothetical protein [Actinacidiphila oryziradicis]|uniref:Aminoglycoside phosphotransferase domain-containing protein n=1 Tax=Actinacidiphila oryziradicis TaxID=2571141 RepID=A0A4U0RUG0_9ACTN|nr:hypothetical protein [Actinacidiphila oryziradicis]TJZ98420.1 hypothetical protein FCI23_48240 [Actinacidiphila oryziradicis]